MLLLGVEGIIDTVVMKLRDLLSFHACLLISFGFLNENIRLKHILDFSASRGFYHLPITFLPRVTEGCKSFPSYLV